MPKPENAGQKAKDAPGQLKEKTFVSPTGEQIVSTQAEYKATLRDQGYKPLDDDDAGDEGVDPVVDPAPVAPVA